MFEFDKSKSEANRKKHGIDFEAARALWEDPNGVAIPARWVEEPRFLLVAKLEEHLWSAIFTARKNRIRIISVRRSREDEKEIYYSSRI